jgi:GT2 family glycosyltransferase
MEADTWPNLNATVVARPRAGGSQAAGASRPAPSTRDRFAVDGKFLARGGRRFRVCGVTYGPFAPDAAGHQFPAPDRVRADFAMMRDGGVNTIRTYHVPPDWLLHLADRAGLAVLIDVPWPRHLCFLDSAAAQDEARRAVRHAATRGRPHRCVLGYSVGNEIPATVVRWHGAARVERFIAELADVARQADPHGLVTYANYPPTEYLDLPFLDFATFNVYLHDPQAFRRYLLRLHNLVGDRPVLLGELGMDTLRHGELAQADHLQGHAREVVALGTAGAVVFAWTDDWHTGGHPITDWAFGITTADRAPKPAYHALREVFGRAPAGLLDRAPRVSVVVCTYNGGATLDQCLRSLTALDYPDYEVIVVDDGSTDATRAVVARHPAVRTIHQPNRGLSVARNVGLKAATGEVVAYTDSDCYADPDWLALLVHQLRATGAAAVGGPNLTPDDGWLAACVAAAPGQPTHVLESDQVAEHVPGCNMAFRRDALLAINGFDPVYRKAGDDVDVCWRLQQAGHWITFAPAAFVWHHRRQNPRAFFRQQTGYGEAEALLRFKHPDRFNSLGDGKWRGVLYGAALRGIRLGGPVIYRGTFGTGLFQCVYRAGPAHWAMLPSTLEWHAAAAVVALAGFAWAPAWGVAGAMLVLSVVVAVLQAAQATLPRRYAGPAARLVVAALCYAQPLVRSWKRYRTRLFSYCPPSRPADDAPGRPVRRLPLSGRQAVGYWSEAGWDRAELLNRLVAHLAEHRWGKVVDSGWSDWDVRIDCYPWAVLEVSTAQEDHGGGRHLIRVRYRVRTSGRTRVVAAAGLGALGLAGALAAWPAAAAAAGLFGVALVGWWRGLGRAAAAADLIDSLARRAPGMIPLRRKRDEPAPAAPEVVVEPGPAAVS